ncbi:MAG: hypothetical protein RLZZ455_49 [Candidatus Parcubacteria bacterium]|jgi:hypothetical protein
MIETDQQPYRQLSMLQAESPEVSSGDVTSFTPLEERVLRYLRPGFTEDHEMAFREIARSYDILDHQIMVLLLLHSVYRQEGDPASARLKRRGRELYDRIARHMGQEVTPQRHVIDEYLARNQVDAVLDIDGIFLVQRAEERIPGEVCFNYAFQFPAGQDFATFWEEEGGARYEASHPVPGAIALYYNDFVLDPSHAGILTKDGRVISKWGDAHVFEHEPHLVPSIYGEIKTYLTPTR